MKFELPLLVPLLHIALAGTECIAASTASPKTATQAVAVEAKAETTTAKPKRQFQYKSDGIEVPGATANEPKVKAFGPGTVRAARKYLDDGAHEWVREHSCMACHTTGVYMVERPMLPQLLGRPSEEVWTDFVESIPKKPGDSPIKSVWRSAGLAS